jgi:Mg2+/citrate symporter
MAAKSNEKRPISFLGSFFGTLVVLALLVVVFLPTALVLVVLFLVGMAVLLRVNEQRLDCCMQRAEGKPRQQECPGLKKEAVKFI